jgi:hypothetical protein
MWAVLILAWPTLGFGATYYASPGGSKAGLGTLADPWDQTKACSSAVLTSGDIVILRGGDYVDTGNNFVPITNYPAVWRLKDGVTYKAKGGEIPVLMGKRATGSGANQSIVYPGSNTTMDSLHFIYGSKWAIFASGANVTIRNCYFNDTPMPGCDEGDNCGCMGAEADGRYMDGWLVENNTFGNNINGRAAIHSYGMRNTTIRNNVFDTANGTYGAIYMKVGSGSPGNVNNEWYGNTFYQNGGAAMRVHCNGIVSGLYIHNNLLVNAQIELNDPNCYVCDQNLNNYFIYNNTFDGGWHILMKAADNGSNQIVRDMYIFNNLFYHPTLNRCVQHENLIGCNGSNSHGIMGDNWYQDYNAMFQLSGSNWLAFMTSSVDDPLGGTYTYYTRSQWQTAAPGYNSTWVGDPHSLSTTAVTNLFTDIANHNYGLNPAGANYTFLSTGGSGPAGKTPLAGGSWPTYIGAYAARRVYYVRTAGSDAADGKSWATAWQTNAKVQATVTAGDTVIYGRGTWAETRLDPPAGGSNSAWTVYACSTWFTGTTAAEKLAGVGLTTLSGAKAVTGWHDTTVAGTVLKVSYYSPAVTCKSDVSGRYGDTPVLRRQGHDSMYVPLAQGDVSYMATVSGGHAYAGGDDEGNAILIKVYPGESALTSTDTVWASCGAAVDFSSANNGANHIKFWGFNIYEGMGAALTIRGANHDSLFFEHCRLRYGGNDAAGNNPAAFLTEGGSSNVNNRNYYFIACDFGWGCAVPNGSPPSSSYGTAPWDGIRGHGAVVMVYSVTHCVFDSCTIDNGFGAHGIYFKQTKIETPGPPWLYSTVKNCTLDGDYCQSANVTDPSGVMLYNFTGNDSVYGNIIKNFSFGMMKWYSSGGTSASTGNGMTVRNNTFYNNSRDCVGYQGEVGVPLGTYDANGYDVKYNIGYKDGSYTSGGAVKFFSDCPTGAQALLQADYNLWYNNGGTLQFGCFGGSSATWAQWRSGTCGGYSYDLNGKNENPGFANAAAGDFSRPDVRTDEMSADYGGRHWSVYGAIQPSGIQTYVRANYYVSPGGNDLNVGSSLSPWLTMLKACTTAQQNDTVFVYPGTYRSAAGWYAGDYDAGTLAPTHAGTDATHPLVFRSVPGMARPIIEGQIADGQKDRHAATITQSYIVLDSLIFRNAAQGIYVDNATDVTIRNCVVDTVAAPDADTLVAGIFVGASATVTNLLLKDDTIRYVRQRTTSPPYSYYDRVDDRAVLAKRSRNGTYWGLQVDNMGTGKGIEFTTASALDSVYSCRIKNVGVGIAAQACDTMKIFLNVISSFDSLGIRLAQNSANPNRDTRIYSNTIYSAGPTGGGLFLGYQGNTVNSNWTRPQIYDNIIVAGGAPFYRAEAIYGAEVVDTVTSGIYTLYENYNLVYNSPGADFYRWVSSGNTYDLTGWKALVPSHGQNDLSTDPLFVDAPNGDFRLMYASPARLGSSTGGVMGALSAISSSTFRGTSAVTLRGVKRK